MKKIQTLFTVLATVLVTSAGDIAGADPFVPKDAPILKPGKSAPLGNTATPPANINVAPPGVVAPLPPAALSTRVTGKLSFANCSPRTADVSLLVDGRIPGSVRIGPHPVDEFAWQYTIDGLAVGTHSLTAQLAASRCRGGRWAPASRSVTLRPGGTAAGNDFHYSVSPGVARINTRLVALAIEGAFHGTRMRINNYGPRRGNTWHVPNDSYLRLGSGLGGGEGAFNIPEVRETPYRYYVNDMNLTRVQALFQDGQFLLSFQFESNGTEIKGRCASSGVGTLLCAAGSDSSAPDFQLSSTRTAVFLQPVRYGDSISYGNVRTRFSTRIDGSGLGEVVEGLVRSEIRSAVENVTQRMLDQEAVRRQIADALRSVLASNGVGAVSALRVEGENLVIEHLPR